MDNELKNEVIFITNIELKEKKRKDGTTWKDFDVHIKDQERGLFYTLPIHRADGATTKAYEFYKLKKSSWEDVFIANGQIPVEIAYSEKKVAWEQNGKKGTTTYRTIRMMRESDEAIIDLPNVGEVEDIPM